MAFVKFTESGRSFRPKASVRSNGTIGLSEAAVEKFGLKAYKNVVLHYDAEHHLVGVKPTKADEDGVHTMNFGKTGAWVAARRFVDYFGIAPPKTKKSDAKWDEKEKMIVFDIS